MNEPTTAAFLAGILIGALPGVAVGAFAIMLSMLAARPGGDE